MQASGVGVRDGLGAGLGFAASAGITKRRAVMVDIMMVVGFSFEIFIFLFFWSTYMPKVTPDARGPLGLRGNSSPTVALSGVEMGGGSK